MIIHILGASGSGKTTLAKQIAKKYKNIIIVDTDDIDDPNCLKSLKNINLMILKKICSI
jgi:adenylate kinase family enzyme